MKNVILKYYHSYIQETPKEIRAFLRNALILFVIWKLVYSFIFLDSRILDRPLTNHVGEATVYFLNNCTFFDGFTSMTKRSRSYFEGQLQTDEVSQLQHYGKNVLFIADGCNGLELMVLFVGFIICFPSAILKKIVFIVFGVIVIDVFNVLRCSGLAFLKEHYHDYFDFSHHYVFKITLYAIIFLMWILFTKKIKFSNAVL